MIPFYMSSEKDKRKEEAFNTCIKSLQNMLDYHQYEESRQDYTQITYKGPFSGISSAKITYPRKLPKMVPLIGTVGGYLMILGYTDGVTIATSSIEPPNRTLKDETEERVEVESMGQDSTTVEKSDNKILGVRVITTTTVSITYEQVDEGEDEEVDWHYYKTTKTTVVTEVDRSVGDVNICMRF